jgi:hypothetical protein
MMPAEECIELLRGRLAAFRLNMDTDIVAVCTDGASVMCRVGRLMSAEHQLCIVHGIHLVVQDILYKGPGLRGSTAAEQLQMTKVTASLKAKVTAELSLTWN